MECVRFQGITEVKQLFAESVFMQVSTSPRHAYRNAEREIIFQRQMGDRRYGRLYRHRFSTIFLCPRAIQRSNEWLRLHSEGRKEKKGWGCA